MNRLLLALLLTLCIHGFFILSQFHTDTIKPPKITGDTRIAISLSQPLIPKKAEKSVQPPKPQQESRNPDTVTPEVKQVLKATSPAILKANSVKKIYRSVPPSTKQVEKRIKQPPPLATKATPKAAAPVSVKTSPLYKNNKKPNYPALARHRNWQGITLLSVMVSEKGAADRVLLFKSSGYPLLDNSALKTVATWRFLPGTISGRPTAMEILIPIHFKLR